MCCYGASHEYMHNTRDFSLNQLSILFMENTVYTDIISVASSICAYLTFNYIVVHAFLREMKVNLLTTNHTICVQNGVVALAF